VVICLDFGLALARGSDFQQVPECIRFSLLVWSLPKMLIYIFLNCTYQIEKLENDGITKQTISKKRKGKRMKEG